MYRLKYCYDKYLEISLNKAPSGFLPLWVVEVTAYKFSEIPEKIYDMLSGDDKLAVIYFFHDIEEMNKQLTKIYKGE